MRLVNSFSIDWVCVVTARQQDRLEGPATPGDHVLVWARIPEPFQESGSLEFSKSLLAEANVAVSPGIGFGEFGDDHVRSA